MSSPALLVGRTCRLAIVLVLATGAGSASAQVYVRGYTNSNGTYVAPHYRSNPDGNFSNNWSTVGNRNPYTGAWGTKTTAPGGDGEGWATDDFERSHFGGVSVGGIRSADSTSGWQVDLGNSDAKLRDLRAINYRGVGFLTTHQQFLRAIPHAKPNGPIDASGVISYAIEDLEGKRDAVWFQFVDNQFLQLGFMYGKERIREYGGTKVLNDRAQDRFGTPSRSDNGRNIWDFPSIDRMVVTGQEGEKWYLAVTRQSLHREVDERKTRVDVGF